MLWRGGEVTIQVPKSGTSDEAVDEAAQAASLQHLFILVPPAMTVPAALLMA